MIEINVSESFFFFFRKNKKFHLSNKNFFYKFENI
jgi:hypothetical protein